MAVRDAFTGGKRRPGPRAERSGAARAGRLRLPEEIDRSGLLVGWSLEHVHRRQPAGFSFGGQERGPDTGYADPILMAGEGHLMTIAPTGSGKGVGCVVPTLLRHPGPVIVIDPKGENVAITARRRREMGHRVIVLDPLEVTGQTPDSLNPLNLVDPLNPLGVDDAAALAAALLPQTGSDRDAFWISRGRELLLGLICHVLVDLPPERRSLATVREVLHEGAANTGGMAARLGTSRHPEARRTAGMLNIAADSTVGGYVALAQEGIDVMRGPLVQRHTARSTFALGDVTRGEPLSIFIVVPPHMLEPLGSLLRLWVGVLMTAIMRRRARPALSTLLVLDEAAQLGPLAQLRQAITLLRGYGLQTWSFWQDPSQLKRLYPADWPTMINNCRAVQCFGANTMLAAREMAALVGYHDPDRVLDLERDEMLLQIAGDEAVIAKVPNYRSDPAFDGLHDDNPYYDAALDPMPLERKPLEGYLRPKAKPRLRRPTFDSGPGRASPPDRAANADLLRRLKAEMEADRGTGG